MMNMHDCFVIETDRLVLRHWHNEDAAGLYRYASDERVSELALWPRHTSVEMSREVIEKIFIPNPYSFAMVLKETGETIGCIGLVPQGMEHYEMPRFSREVGYWIGHPYWNRGLTTEALTGLIDFLYRNMDLCSLIITADSRNQASHRVALKAGFNFVGDYVHDGVPGKAFRLKLKR